MLSELTEGVKLCVLNREADRAREILGTDPAVAPARQRPGDAARR